MDHGEFDARYERLPQIINSWVSDIVDLKSADILDFGCGEGITALGLVNKYSAKCVFGVDIMPDVLSCLDTANKFLGATALPNNLYLRQIHPGGSFFEEQRFDLIYSWSAFEHIDQALLPQIVRHLRSRLNRGGIAFMQIAPLYYSAEGSHLFHKIPEPWGHLALQESIYYSKLCAVCDSQKEVEALWSCYQTLNKIQPGQLINLLNESGFKVIREYYTEDEYSVPEVLKGIFVEKTLKKNQVVLLAKAV